MVCFNVFMLTLLGVIVAKLTNDNDTSLHDAFKSSHVHHMSLRVTYFASSFGTRFRVFSKCSKYVMFSICLGAHVLQTAVCVTFGVRRLSVPLRSIGCMFATLAAKAAQQFWNDPASSGFSPPRSPQSALNHPQDLTTSTFRAPNSYPS